MPTSAAMIVRALAEQSPFTTKDGSTIRSLLDLSTAPVMNQSLAEASLPSGGSTQRHYHQVSEEFYFITSGTGRMEVDGVVKEVTTGDAVLIPPGAWHELVATSPLTLLCMCAPPYSHDDTYFE